MNLPLFPDPVPPESTPPPRPRPSTALPASREPQRVSENASVLASSPPLSIRDIAALIHDRMRALTVLGPRIVHAQWLRPGINAGSRGFLSVTLADTQDSSVAIDGFIWERADTDAILKQGQAFGCDLSDRESRCEVMLDVTIDFWVKKAKPYLRIHRLNQIGMKGLRQQQREATLKQLDQEGLLVRNKAMAWHRPTLRVLCIGKRDSDGCRDALSILKRSGFRFEATILNVAVQGVAAVPTLLDAFAQLASCNEEFDVVLLIRGGGNELDLVAYDDYEVAKAVALCGLPVVTGLGHTADQSMCDMVSYKALETPTAAARFLVDQIQALHDRLRMMRDRLRGCAVDHVAGRRRDLLSQRPRFVRTALSSVHDRQRQRVAQWHQLSTALRACLQHSRGRLQERYQAMPLETRQVLQIHRTLIAECSRMVWTGAPALVSARRHYLHLWRQTLPLTALSTIVGPARFSLRRCRQQIYQAGCDTVRRTMSTLHRLHAHIQAASPERYFALGLSYVTGPDGTVVRSRAQVSSGDHIEIHVMDGRIDATVTKKEQVHDD
jgi:exodeoxyribonuclease VII large subunit